MLYQTYQLENDESNEVIIINQFDNILDAYKSIDENSQVIPFHDYFLNCFNSTFTINDFVTTFSVKIDNIIRQLGMIRRDLPARSRLTDVYVLTSGDRIYLFTNDDYYLRDLNNILEEELQSKVYIRKNPDVILNQLKVYLQNHISELLYIVDELISRKLYNAYTWQKKKDITFTTNLMVSNTDEQEQNTELDFTYAEDYNEDDVYSQIKADVIYSANEVQVVNDFISDLDLILSIFIENLNLVKNLNLSSDIKNIIRYM